METIYQCSRSRKEVNQGSNPSNPQGTSSPENQYQSNKCGKDLMKAQISLYLIVSLLERGFTYVVIVAKLFACVQNALNSRDSIIERKLKIYKCGKAFTTQNLPS